jgi:hypothetical protein
MASGTICRTAIEESSNDQDLEKAKRNEKASPNDLQRETGGQEIEAGSTPHAVADSAPINAGAVRRMRTTGIDHCCGQAAPA